MISKGNLMSRRTLKHSESVGNLNVLLSCELLCWRFNVRSVVLLLMQHCSHCLTLRRLVSSAVARRNSLEPTFNQIRKWITKIRPHFPPSRYSSRSFSRKKRNYDGADMYAEFRGALKSGTYEPHHYLRGQRDHINSKEDQLFNVK